MSKIRAHRGDRLAVVCQIILHSDSRLARWCDHSGVCESSGSHAAAAHHDGHGKGDNETNECYGLIKKHPYKALQCYEAVDPTLKVLLKKDTDGNAIYENLIRACGHDYVGGLVNAKELGICRRKLIVLDKYPRQP